MMHNTAYNSYDISILHRRKEGEGVPIELSFSKSQTLFEPTLWIYADTYMIVHFRRLDCTNTY